jgi:pyrophosphatase PpaX
LEHQTKAVLFDLDGTLIDTTDLILRCFQFSWSTVCGFEHPRETLIDTFGTPLRDSMYHLLARDSAGNGIRNAEAETSTVEELILAYRTFNVSNHDVLARPFEGTREVLTELRRRSYSIAVVTSKGRELALRGLRLCSLHDLLDSAIFLEDTTLHKPHPAPILAALERLGTPLDAAAYVGDSRHDIIAARAAGIRSVGALWGPFPRAAIEREGPTFIAESITELLEIFN